MSDTQILVLTITFLLAGAIVLPLIFLAYRKEQRRLELENRRAREATARKHRREQAELEEQRNKQVAQKRKATVGTLDGLKDRFKELRYSTYASPPCSKCASTLVHILEMGEDTGVLTCRCIKCGTKKRVYAISRSAYWQVAAELSDIMQTYRAVMNFYPNYPGLAVSFPEPAPSSD